MNTLKLKILSLISLLALSLAASPVSLATAQGTQLQVSPTKTTLDANAGDKKQVLITVKNLAPNTQKFTAGFNNFTAMNETGDPKIIDDATFAHGLKTWMSGLNSIALSTNSSGNYTLTLSIPNGTKPGTYYGIVSFTAGDGSASVGSLVFVNVGAITQQAALEEFITSGVKVDSAGQASGKFAVRVKNTGNGFTVPSVKIEILDDKKTVTETLDANKDGGGILPGGTIRKYETDFSKKLEPNKTYSARVTITAGGNKPLTQEKTFVDAPASVTPPASSSKSQKSNLLPIIGAVAGGLVVLTLVVLLAKKRNKPLSRMPTAIPPQPTGQPLAPNGPIIGDTTAVSGPSNPPSSPENSPGNSPHQPPQ